MILWPFGLVALWLCDLVTSWLCVLVALWPWGSSLVILWSCDLVAFKIFSFVNLWRCNLVALCPCGSVTLSLFSWACGIVTLRPCGVILLPCVLVAFWPWDWPCTFHLHSMFASECTLYKATRSPSTTYGKDHLASSGTTYWEGHPGSPGTTQGNGHLGKKQMILTAWRVTRQQAAFRYEALDFIYMCPNFIFTKRPEVE